MSDTQSLIGRNVEVQGNVIFDGELRVEGKIKGSVISTVANGALLVIANTGIVEGEIHAPAASINGVVSGSIYTEGLLDLSSTAFVAGDVYYKSLAMAAGARVDGNLVCTADDPSGTVIPPP
ncbi:hypothetical protein GCM10027431_13210 [Lysobacter rhizosphaerae]